MQKAIDERTKYGIVGDSTDVMMKVAAAEAMKEAAKNPGGAGFVGAGMGIGMGAEFGREMGKAMQSASSAPQKDKENMCPYCGAPVRAGAKFCGECGSNLGGKKLCPRCGSEVHGNNKFCPECGAKL